MRCCAPRPTRAACGVLGTINNCASGITPWGTYLTCEENFIFYFKGPDQPNAHEQRWGLRKGDPVGYRWHEFDERFDATKHPNEPNRFGWVVEIDPLNPSSVPVKRTALGRAAHEGATVATTRDGRAVVYMGEDARFEYIYKFVSRDAIKPGGASANATLLDHGTLYVARFDADGSGRWLALQHGQGPLVAANGFADQGEVLVKSRQASDRLGATKMDRPEWIAVDAKTGWVYCTLTNNSNRGGSNQPATDAANPRANNTMGHIIRWKESGDFDGTAFEWNHFVLAGDPANERAEAKGNVKGDAFGCPDGLWIDGRGVLVGADRHEHLGHGQGRPGQARQQRDAGGRPVQRRHPALSRRAGGLRGHRRHRHARWAHDVRQHPASGRKSERAQRTRAAAPLLQLARLQPQRPAPLGDGGDPQARWRCDRHLTRCRAAATQISRR